MALPENSRQYVFKSQYRKIKIEEKPGPKDWAQGIGAALVLCMFSILFCTVIMMRFP